MSQETHQANLRTSNLAEFPDDLPEKTGTRVMSRSSAKASGHHGASIMKAIKTQKQNFATATWIRKSGELSLIRLAFPRNCWIGTVSDRRLVCANSATYRVLTAAVTLCQSARAVVWMTGGTELPPSLKPNQGQGAGALLIAPRGANLSAKEWRSVRNKLAFLPRSWSTPTNDQFESWKDWEAWRLGEGEGTYEDDGSTLLLRLNPDGLAQLARIAWALHGDRRELIDYHIGYCLTDEWDWNVRFCYSTFRTEFRYAWESDEDMRRRMSNPPAV